MNFIKTTILLSTFCVININMFIITSMMTSEVIDKLLSLEIKIIIISKKYYA